ncbi:MAG: hypothetical protein M3176_17090 [Chloroflexota bacterium]|nr:hypothetical protein [Chloroflexota bacterium]
MMNNPKLLDVVTHEPADGDDTDIAGQASMSHRGVGIWGVLLALVILFGYLTAARRKSLGTFAEQIADIVRDFRGYDPEF